MKVKLTAHVYYNKYRWEDKGEYLLFYAKVDSTDTMIYVNSQELEIEVPENFDPRPSQIAALEAQKQKARADYQATVNDINDRISKLQAIEYTA
jgi:hypothetical protein